MFIDRQQEINSWYLNYFKLPFEECTLDSFYCDGVRNKLDCLTSAQRLNLQKQFYRSTLFLSVAEMSLLFSDDIKSMKKSYMYTDSLLNRLDGVLRHLVYSVVSEEVVYFLNISNLKEIFLFNFKQFNHNTISRNVTSNVIVMAKRLGYDLIDPLKVNNSTSLLINPNGSEEVQILNGKIFNICSFYTFFWDKNNTDSFRNILENKNFIIAKERYVSLDKKINQICKYKKLPPTESIYQLIKGFISLIGYPCYSVDGKEVYLDSQELFEIIHTFIAKYQLKYNV